MKLSYAVLAILLSSSALSSQVTSFNGRKGNITLSKTDVFNACPNCTSMSYGEDAIKPAFCSGKFIWISTDLDPGANTYYCQGTTLVALFKPPVKPPPTGCTTQPIATTMTFTQAVVATCSVIVSDYQFGTDAGRNVANISQLGQSFNALTANAGSIVINGQWQIYSPQFNTANYVFTGNTLDLTALAPGGLCSGCLTSGQLASKTYYQPGKTGLNTYAFEIQAKVPGQGGAWPAMWFYGSDPLHGDGSEIDVEFFNEINGNQDSHDWTGFNHGPGSGTDFYSIMTNQWVWHPGMDFAADYHLYQYLWTTTAIYKYVDGKLILATNFKWTSPATAQLIIDMQVGTNLQGLITMQPNSLSEFPIKLSLNHVTIWGK